MNLDLFKLPVLKTLNTFETNDVRNMGPDSPSWRRYWDMRRAGQSHSIALLLATRKFPSINTDSTFNSGRCNGNQFEHVPGLGDHYRRIAEAHGVNTTGKHYCSGLASFPGDPTAWINDRGDVARVASEKGFSVQGAVNYQAPEREAMPDVEIAPDLIAREVEERLEEDPGARREDVYEQVYNLRTGRVDPNPLRVTDHDFQDAE